MNRGHVQDPPRTRRQTRAAILCRLLGSDGLYRPRLAADCRLTEGSISRILAELRTEGLIDEPRCPTPYPGGPSSVVVLHPDIRVAALEFANDRLGFAVANLAGTTDTVAHLPLPAGAASAMTARAVAEAVDRLSDWCRHRAVTPRQIAVTIPGHRDTPGPNPILQLDAAALERRLRTAFPGVPVAICNTVTAHAAAHLCTRTTPAASRQFFVYLGHGVGAAWVDPPPAEPAIRAVELGHVVLDPAGPACRCGHHGCLEAHASTVALAALLGVPEADLLAAGPDWPALTRVTPRREAAVRKVLLRTGLVIGNALNTQGPARIAVCGWPAALPPPLRDALAEGVRLSLFGGLSDPITFLHPAPAQEPAAALAYAVHALVSQGGMPAAEEEPRPRLSA